MASHNFIGAQKPMSNSGSMILMSMFISYFFPEEVCVNPMMSYTDSCNCSDSSDIELNDEWVGKKSPKLSRGSRSCKFCLTKN